jgi:molecular chaperone GrpE
MNPGAEEQTAEDIAAQVEAAIKDATDAQTDDASAIDPAEALAAAQVEIADLKEQVLRAQAEQQNVRRRAERDVESARKYALEKFGGDLVPVVDNLERALDAANLEDEALKSFAEGVQLTQKSFLDVLAKYNLVQLNPVGEPFDPQFHEAMSMVEAPDAEPNSVLHVVQKGYTLNGRLVRAAMVVISKPASKIDAEA